MSLKQIYTIEKSQTQFSNVSMQSFSDKTADSETFNRKFYDTQFTEISINRFCFPRYLHLNDLIRKSIVHYEMSISTL